MNYIKPFAVDDLFNLLIRLDISRMIWGPYKVNLVYVYFVFLLIIYTFLSIVLTTIPGNMKVIAQFLCRFHSRIREVIYAICNIEDIKHLSHAVSPGAHLYSFILRPSAVVNVLASLKPFLT